MTVHSISVRKDNEMAKCRSRGNKLFIDYVVDGRRIRKSTGLEDTKKNREIVEIDLIPKLLKMIASGEIHQKKSKKFGHYFIEFLKMKDGNRSYFNKIAHWNKLNSVFKDFDIDRITRLDVKSYLVSMPIKSRSKGIYKSALLEIFELAIDDGIIKTNPAVNIRLRSDHKKEIDYFRKEEVKILLDNAEGIMLAYLMIAFYTGMRPEEILGLQIGDFTDKHISIKRVRTCGRIDHPKTRNSIRTVPYPSFIMDSVKAIQNDSIFLFGDIDDTVRLRYQWWKLLKKCGFEKRRMYSTRHTFATIMLQDRIVSLNELAGLLGHSSPKITLAHYASIIDAKTIEFDKGFDLFGTPDGTRHTQNRHNALV